MEQAINPTFEIGQIDKMNTIKLGKQFRENTKRSAYNWRFGTSGGVAPQKVQWEYDRLCPA